MMEDILVSRDDAIATIHLNKPEQLNALDRVMWQDLGDIFSMLGREPNVRCLILSSTDRRAFTAGADVKAFVTERNTLEHSKLYDYTMRQTLLTIYKHPCPVVTAVNGLCFGGAIALTAVTDICLCSSGSRFGVPVNRLGLPMPIPEIDIITSLVGPARMSALLLEARMLNAEEAFSIGLVSQVITDQQIEAAAVSIAYNIISGAPLVNHWHKRFIRRLLDQRATTAIELEECYIFLDTMDYTEGLQAFQERRLPSFAGV